MSRTHTGEVLDQRHRQLRRWALGTVSAFGLISSAVSAAMAADAAQEGAISEIVVTGSRIAREGYNAPTPLTVVDTTAIQSAPNANVADYLNTRPIFSVSGANTPQTNSANISNGAAGLNALNLRGLGLGRTLVLLDGQRSVSAIATGGVDINNIPQQLIQRVDVVTGGASAVYGSDAVSGVANFILDKTFTGVKGEISGGLTSYGDGENYKASLTGGFPFAGGRGHVLLSGEIAEQREIGQSYNRAWELGGWGVIVNPAYGTGAGQTTTVPQRLVLDQVGISNATHGGIIVAGPLKGTAFGEGGVPYKFNYGDMVNDPKMRGGDWYSTLVTPWYGSALLAGDKRQNVFTRLSYDVSDNINIFVQSSWNHVASDNGCCKQFQEGNAGTVLSGNPFIPASVQAQMTAMGITSFRLGSMNYDLPQIRANNERWTTRNVLGASGKFDALGTGWSWNGYFQHGRNRSSIFAPGTTLDDRRPLALDAVRDSSGRIVCRSTLTDPTNGCQPYNPMGIGVNTEAAINYLTANSGPYLYQGLKQVVFGGSVTGEPFSLWTGPVSIALNAEHRTESGYGFTDANSARSNWFVGDYRAINGKYSVTEGAFETIIPLANGQAWADNWDFSAAARFTEYSTSGFVTTWKLGTTYSPIPDIKLRVTRSRDIRSSNLQELFGGNPGGTGGIDDPFCLAGPKQIPGATCNPVARSNNGGNLNLNPEKADTTGIGVVLQPSFMPGFAVSVDYWRIKIRDAITTVNAANTVRLCFEGIQELCPNINRVNGAIDSVLQVPINIATATRSGIDIEASYTFGLDSLVSSWAGNMRVHTAMTINEKDYALSGLPGDSATENVGSQTTPDWTLTGSVSYDLDPFQATLTARAKPPMLINSNYIACTTGCPVSTLQNITYNTLDLPGHFYLDLSTSYKFAIQENVDSEVFLNIRNLTNKDPGIIPLMASYYLFHQSNAGTYDTLGRVFRAGVRFRM